MQNWVKTIGLLVFSLSLSACASASSQGGGDSYWSDSGTTLRVKTALMSAGVVDFSLISVSTHNGVVELDGSVGSDQEQELAGTTAQGVSGVKQVENNLTVNASD